MRRLIDPPRDLGAILLGVEKPARYAGGEYGRLARAGKRLQAVVSFPDVYEIGMSNQALKILYNRLNALEHVSCDRAFAPAPDFEAALARAGVPLYGLDTGIALKDADLLLFSLGYELGIGGALSMLAASGIPLRAGGRGGEDPVVVAGGVCASNPLPYAAFIDAFWIGEAEAGFFALAEELSRLKGLGAGRDGLLAALRAHPSVWYAGKPEKARRAVHASFATDGFVSVYPVPSMRVVQQHGFVEIMRGCPNGCRFCHAGFWYRPMRQKESALVHAEVAAFVERGGFNEICLSSLSSADYAGIDRLLFALGERYRARRVSFQLPSLHVSTFSLPLLEELSRVRKSGLTFAVETPDPGRQQALNKTLGLDQITEILREAKRRGWKSAKLYFMLGLCLKDDDGNAGSEDEASAIVDFTRELTRRTRMTLSVNAGAFIPKPHTPFQWMRQDRGAAEAGRRVAHALRAYGHKVRSANGLAACVEGALSRGDERAALLIEEAFAAGARLDAWEEHFNAEVWRRVLDGHAPLVDEFLGARDPSRPLPWDRVEGGLSAAALEREKDRARAGLPTPPCESPCAEPCGACRGAARLSRNAPPPDAAPETPPPVAAPAAIYRAVFSFGKAESAVFLPHLSVIEVFFAAFTRAALPVIYSEGFNPLPRLSFASPLSVGIRARAEIAALDLHAPLPADEFRARLAAALPAGFTVGRAEIFPIPAGAKKVSPAAALWGFAYRRAGRPVDDLVPAAEEKAYRAAALSDDGGLAGLTRRATLARAPGKTPAGIGYFAFYRGLYGH